MDAKEVCYSHKDQKFDPDRGSIWASIEARRAVGCMIVTSPGFSDIDDDNMR